MNTTQQPATAAAKATFAAYFAALATHIHFSDDIHTVDELAPNFAPIVSEGEKAAMTKLMLNAWSAEYALRITPVVSDDQYLQSSLHWTFPQGYYSVLFSARAFLLLSGQTDSNEETIRQHIAKAVIMDYYPASLKFVCRGPFGRFQFVGCSDEPEAMQSFLKATRFRRVKALIKSLQDNPKTALRSAVTGEITHELTPTHHQSISRKIGVTTFFDTLARLRISSTNREIETLNLGLTDVRAFHQQLVTVVSHINEVHERYIKRALGETGFRTIIEAMPSYLQEGFVAERHPRKR